MPQTANAMELVESPITKWKRPARRRDVERAAGAPRAQHRQTLLIQAEADQTERDYRIQVGDELLGKRYGRVPEQRAARVAAALEQGEQVGDAIDEVAAQIR